MVENVQDSTVILTVDSHALGLVERAAANSTPPVVMAELRLQPPIDH